VWLCPSHHCDDCARSATMSCAFCPSAFCSEHYHGNVRLTEYYQLACRKHDDVVLCEDPSVLKIFGLCKPPKASSSRKPLRRKSSGGVRRVRDGSEEAELGGGDHAVSEKQTPKHKRKSGTPVSEARERNVKRSCRDRSVKKELDPTASLDSLSAQLGRDTDNVKRPSSKKEQQHDKQHRRSESETGRKRVHSLEKDNRTVHSGSSPSSAGLKKDKKHADTSARDHRHHQAVDPDDLRKCRKSSEALAHDHNHHGKRDQDVDRQVQKRRRVKGRESTRETSLNFSSSAATNSSSSLLLADTAGMDRHSSGKSVANSAVTPAKSLVDEPLFDNSDDEFPELVIDVPTI